MKIKYQVLVSMLIIEAFLSGSLLYAQVVQDINTFYNSPTGSYEELSASDIYFVPKETDSFQECTENGHIYKSDGTGQNENDIPQLYLCKNGTWSLLGESDWDQELDPSQPNYMAVYLRNDGFDENGDPIRVGIGTDPDEDLLLKLNLGYGVTNGLGHDGSISSVGKYNEGIDIATAGVSGPGTKMIWYPKKAAFRAGILDAAHSDYWDNPALASVAFGKNTKASAHAGFAIGELSEATGDMKSTAMGYNAKAQAKGATAIGNNVMAKTFGESAFGECNYEFTSQGPLPPMYNWNAGDVSFSIGNGRYDSATNSCSEKSNAITTLKTGMTRIDAGLNAFNPQNDSAGDYVKAALQINADKLIAEHTSAELVFITKALNDPEFTFDSYHNYFNILKDSDGYPESGSETKVVLHAIRDDTYEGAVGIMTDNVTEGYNLDVDGDILATGNIEVYGYMRTKQGFNTSSPCSTRGLIGFNVDHFYYCDGNRWKKILYEGEIPALSPPSTPPTRSGCFLAGTLVAMADGTTKAIEKINAGDMVVSFDEEKQELAQDKVLRFIEVQQDGYFIINGRIKVTAKHPFYVQGKWVEAKDLKVGDILLTKDMKEEPITSIEKKERTVNVYNIEVDRNNTFIASGIVVHNKRIILPGK